MPRAVALLRCGLAAVLLLSAGCEKNSASASNKAFLSVIHAVPGVKPVDVLLQGNLLTSSGGIPFGQSSGQPGLPYFTTSAGTHEIRVNSQDSLASVFGNIALHIGSYYSLFLYDTLSAGKLGVLLLPDQLLTPADTLSGFRFLDLCPDTATLYIAMTNATDTINLSPQTFVGTNPVPANLSPFNSIKAGQYGLQVTVNGQAILQDSVIFGRGQIFTIYSIGFTDPAAAVPLAIRVLRHL